VSHVINTVMLTVEAVDRSAEDAVARRLTSSTRSDEQHSTICCGTEAGIEIVNLRQQSLVRPLSTIYHLLST